MDHITNNGPDSSVGIATELWAGRSGDLIPVGRDFPPVQTSPRAYPASCTVGTGSFPGVKRHRGVLLTANPLLVPRSWENRAIPLLTLWATTETVTTTGVYKLRPAANFQKRAVYQLRPGLFRARVLVASRCHFSGLTVVYEALEGQSISGVPRSLFK